MQPHPTPSHAQTHDTELALIEQGQAFATLHANAARSTQPRAPEATSQPSTRRVEVLVIGGGQAGLSVGYHLARRGVRFEILDASERVGDAWRNRWDSLRLFTPARHNSLDGLRFPAPGDSFPTKDEMADYLASYAERFALPVRNGVRVERLTKQDGRFVATTNRGRFEADQVVVAMANMQTKRLPAFASELRGDIVQLHSSEYENLSQLQDGGVLIVGAGNSGAELAMEVAPTHRTLLSGRTTGEVPFHIGSWLGRKLLVRIVLRFVFHRVLTIRTPLGRKLRPKLIRQGGPLIRQKSSDLTAAGVERVARVASVRDGLPVLADGRRVEVRNVIWCTGFEHGFSWIDLPVRDDEGRMRHEAGVSTDVPGLYFVGLHFLYSMSSLMVHGVGRDAARIAAQVAERQRNPALALT